ncbi:IS110 family transposase [Corynebacterium silvaticum]|uniref:IS110 family transposase n=1 Tax=Corynebacterium silvaticum TaxID=2320431 RepID=UPI001CECB688
MAKDFDSAGNLAAYAGIAPVTRRSGSSIRGEFPARSGNKRLKNALFYFAFAAIRSRNLPGTTPMQRHLRNAEKQKILPRNPTTDSRRLIP